MNDLRQWRSVQIAGNLLYSSNLQITIENSPIQLFDLLVSVNESFSRFGVVVRSSTFVKTVEFSKYLSNLKIYKNDNMINIPLLLFCINSNEEIGTFDFIAKPVRGTIVINEDLALRKITSEALGTAVKIVKEYFVESKSQGRI